MKLFKAAVATLALSVHVAAVLLQFNRGKRKGQGKGNGFVGNSRKKVRSKEQIFESFKKGATIVFFLRKSRGK